MTREQKIQKRTIRSALRRKKRREVYTDKIKRAHKVGYGVPLSAFKKDGTTNSWPDPNSPTGYTQVCSYKVYGTCQSPCNGDC